MYELSNITSARIENSLTHANLTHANPRHAICGLAYRAGDAGWTNGYRGRDLSSVPQPQPR